jgi:hypothetical protein
LILSRADRAAIRPASSITDAVREDLRQRAAAAGGNVSLVGLTELECEELWYGRVPKRVREMAKAAFDWYWEDLLAQNAAKQRLVRKKARRRR